MRSIKAIEKRLEKVEELSKDNGWDFILFDLYGKLIIHKEAPCHDSFEAKYTPNGSLETLEKERKTALSGVTDAQLIESINLAFDHLTGQIDSEKVNVITLNGK